MSIISTCYSCFWSVDEPIVSDEDILLLFNTYKQKYPANYNTMCSIFDINTKQTLTKNQHLVDKGYYNRSMLFMDQLCVCNPWTCVGWSIVAAGALCSKGIFECKCYRGTYSGIISSLGTFLHHVALFIKSQYILI